MDTDKLLVVLGSGRCGTSAVAGMLVAAGYTAGQRLLSPDRHNKLGYFEDENVVGFNIQLARGELDILPFYERYLRERTRNEHRPLIKDPRLCDVWRTIVPILPHHCVLGVERDVNDVVRSFHRKFPGTECNAEDVWREMSRRQRVCRTIVRDTKGIMIHFDVLLRSPEVVARDLVAFLDLDERELSTMTRHIRPELSEDSFHKRK